MDMARRFMLISILLCAKRLKSGLQTLRSKLTARNKVDFKFSLSGKKDLAYAAMYAVIQIHVYPSNCRLALRLKLMM